MHIDIAFLDAAARWIRASLATALGYFVFVTLVDVVLGVVLALRQNLLRRPNGRFDWEALPSFLGAQYGTKAAGVLAGMVVIAAISNDKDVVGAVRVVLTIGTAGLGTKVAADAVAKALAIFGAGPVAAALRPKVLQQR